MPPGRKPTRSQVEFVEAGIAFADEFGLNALTLRALGTAMGASTTAVYRYFRDKDNLIKGMREHLLGLTADSLVVAADDPVERLIAAALAYRSTVRAHPCLSQIMALPANEGDQGETVQHLVLGQLAEIGLQGPLLARGYQQVESFVVGSSMFDFADAPAHLSDRRERFTRLGHAEFEPVTKDDAAISANNEAAFEASLRAILESLASAASTS